MSLEVSYNLKCDRCGMRSMSSTRALSHIRAQTQAGGWKVIRRREDVPLDLCPLCAEDRKP